MSSSLDPLTQALYETISNIEKWERVLQLLCEETGAKKAILMLRDRLTAELYIPKNLYYEYVSPVIYGFSTEEVKSYITTYSEHDPWTEIENLFHPCNAMALSKHLSLKELMASKFWEWLAPQGISDTIVLDLGTSKDCWVGINLHYDSHNKHIRDKIIKTLNNKREIMTDIWLSGKHHRMSSLDPQVIRYFVDQELDSAIVINSKNEIIHSNKKANTFLEERVIVKEDINRKLKFVDDVFLENATIAFQELDQKKIKTDSLNEIVKEFDVGSQGYSLKVVALENLENIIGEYKGNRLLVIKLRNNDLCDRIPIWDNPILSGKQRKLVEILANGGEIIDYAKIAHVKNETAYYHWNNVKKKLKLKDKTELFTKHQLFLKNYQ